MNDYIYSELNLTNQGRTGLSIGFSMIAARTASDYLKAITLNGDTRFAHWLLPPEHRSRALCLGGIFLQDSRKASTREMIGPWMNRFLSRTTGKNA